jgi:hypothetical protein
MTTFGTLPTRMIVYRFPQWIRAMFAWRMDNFT